MSNISPCGGEGFIVKISIDTGGTLNSTFSGNLVLLATKVSSEYAQKISDPTPTAKIAAEGPKTLGTTSKKEKSKCQKQKKILQNKRY